ncbi:hypothetical protein BD626DRAFT_574187 [Schizophyllum amplum]|uniref:Uncharacterized protein n=1 Tax=Schizophyllum amplum TaxID=97359 RepID=A0A550BZE5_9AGAR|nr:hypothetical protein BD626DRAFT_574183 [Auriculariopsis ampla]TRM57861.1 hypothetical protein BD626DRAFT_574187 [Auriculariopsis ampla]
MAEVGSGNTLRARPPKVPPFGAQISAPDFPVTCLRAHDTALMRAQRIVEAGPRREREGSRVEGYISLLPSSLPPPPSTLPQNEFILIHLYLGHQLCKHPAPLACHSQDAVRQCGTFLVTRDRLDTSHPRSPSYESPEITARDTFRLSLTTTTTPPSSSLRRASSSRTYLSARRGHRRRGLFKTVTGTCPTSVSAVQIVDTRVSPKPPTTNPPSRYSSSMHLEPMPSSSLEPMPSSSLESAIGTSFESASGVISSVGSAAPWASRHTRDHVPRETPREFNFGSHHVQQPCRPSSSSSVLVVDIASLRPRRRSPSSSTSPEAFSPPPPPSPVSQLPHLPVQAEGILNIRAELLEDVLDCC